jgi:murein DD-endopeptidase MepM/ murein hydrolase activator NlpD
VATRDVLRPKVLARKVLLPPVMAGAAVACLLAALALTAATGGIRAHGANPLAGSAHDKLVASLSQETEGTPAASDIRAARKPLPERLRLLHRHPYFALYVRAEHRFHVPWVLVASVHYQETGFGKRPKRESAEARVTAIARQLHVAQAREGGLGAAAVRAVARRYGHKPGAAVSTAMVVERARAWRLLGAIPRPGTGELATPAVGAVGGCGYFGCPRPGHLHNGVDFLAPAGAPVHAADGGRVALLQAPGESGGYGNFLCVQHRPHLASCYAHLSAFAAHMQLGAKVKRGQVIGLVGSTGSSTAPHLHFEVRRGPAACQACAVDPLPLLSGEVPQSAVPKMLSQAGAAASAALPRAAGAAPVSAAPRTAPAATVPVAPPATATPKAPTAAPRTSGSSLPAAPAPASHAAPPAAAPAAPAAPSAPSYPTSSGGPTVAAQGTGGASPTGSSPPPGAVAAPQPPD